VNGRNCGASPRLLDGRRAALARIALCRPGQRRAVRGGQHLLLRGLALALLLGVLEQPRLVRLLNDEEYGPKLRELLALDRRRALHIILGRIDELVVHDELGREAEPDERCARVQVAQHARQNVDVLADWP
jgi:hypothetical protein